MHLVGGAIFPDYNDGIEGKEMVDDVEKITQDDAEGQNTYLGAMRIALKMIDMCDSYPELLQLLADISKILNGDRIETIFPPSE